MENLHNLIIWAIVFLIIGFQAWIFYKTFLKMRLFKELFPTNKTHLSLTFDQETYFVSGIESKHRNSDFTVIVSSINEYLSNNKGSISDFHIIKDAVDRNCDALEEEINAQIPMPLYLGLVGTMLGILIGIGFLVFSGGLDTLLSGATARGRGISELFGGVALAMIASVVGILLTTIGSYLAKDAKLQEEKGKNNFLGWIQANLLPKLSSDTSDSIKKLAQNLNHFNNVFSSNTKELKETLETINDANANQAQLIKAINQLKIYDIASANITVYDKLKDASDEIGVFADYLQKTNEYLENVRLLNENLDIHETRTKAIEEMARFFKEEVSEIEQRKAAISKSVGNVDDYLQQSLSKFKDNADHQLNELKISIVKNHESFQKAIEEQEESLQKKLKGTEGLLDELKNLTSVKTSMTNLEEATLLQNQKIDYLTQAIRQLAEIKTSGTSEIKVNTEMPQWVKTVGITAGGLLSVSCLAFLVPQLIEWVSNLINWLF